MQMQQQMFRDKSSPLLKNPEQVLSFISQVLGTTNTRRTKDEESIEEADSDDEDADSELIIGADDEMLETTITLLLSILEGKKNFIVEVGSSHHFFQTRISKRKTIPCSIRFSPN